jgi:hypothetical protein
MRWGGAGMRASGYMHLQLDRSQGSSRRSAAAGKREEQGPPGRTVEESVCPHLSSPAATAATSGRGTPLTYGSTAACRPCGTDASARAAACCASGTSLSPSSLLPLPAAARAAGRSSGAGGGGPCRAAAAAAAACSAGARGARCSSDTAASPNGVKLRASWVRRGYWGAPAHK